MSHTDPTPHALQTPPWLYARGAIRPWGEATLHVNTEAVRTGFHIFEGLKAFWQADGQGFGIVNLRDHYDRLHRSARIMRMPFLTSFADYEDACHGLLARLAHPEKNMWLRTTLFLVGGHWGQDDVTDLVITAFDHPKGPAAPMATGVSAWRRANDNALPARVKTGPNYLVARFSKIESRDRGYREMILLNDQGRVAEFVGSGLMMVRDGVLVTPPASEGAFESITVLLIEALARDLGIPTCGGRSSAPSCSSPRRSPRSARSTTSCRSPRSTGCRSGRRRSSAGCATATSPPSRARTRIRRCSAPVRVPDCMAEPRRDGRERPVVEEPAR